MKEIKKNELNSTIKAWDNEKWKQAKEMFKIYCKWKDDAREEKQLYDNKPASEIINKAWTNNKTEILRRYDAYTSKITEDINFQSSYLEKYSDFGKSEKKIHHSLNLQIYKTVCK